MLNSRLLETFQAFDSDELEDFKLFVRSPYFNNEGNTTHIIALSDYITTCLFQEEKEAVTKEQAFAVIFPNHQYSEGKLNKLMSALMKVVRKFMIYKYSKIEEDESLQLLALSKFYKDKYLDKRFLDTAKLFENRKKKKNRLDKDDYLIDFIFQQEVTDFYSRRNTRKGDLNLTATFESLDRHYVAIELFLGCMLLTQKSDLELKIKRELLKFEDIEQIFSKAAHLKTPYAIVYRQATEMMKTIRLDREDTYHELKKLLKTHEEELPLEDLKALNTLLRNYCIIRQNLGFENFLKEAFTLYQEHLEKGYLYYYGNKLVSRTVYTMVEFGLKLREYNWAGKFLKKYKDQIIMTDDPGKFYKLNWAKYSFCIGNFEEALNCLAPKYEDVHYNIAARRLEIKIYYETQSPLLDAKMDAFKIYIFRLSKKLLPDVHKELSNNFIDYLRQLLSSVTNKNEKRIEKLHEKISNEKSVAEKPWLLEKLEELK